MQSLKEIVKRYLLAIRHKRFQKKVIKQDDITILSNCCIGGTMYNDLGLQFLSPTINLFFGHHGFIDFVNHLAEYKNADLVQMEKYDVNENGVKAPVGLLKKDGLPDVEIHFLHYNSFENAKNKWFERFQRINYSKIYLVIEAKEEHEYKLLQEYSELPYPKIIFTNIKSSLSSAMYMNFYNSKKNHKKSVTSLVGMFGRRGYDEFDFVDEIFNYDYKE